MPRCRPSLVIGCLIALTALPAGGCGAGTSTVVGKVTYQGQPVNGGSVILYCPDKQIVRSIIGPDGSYSIPNVPCGSAVVTVQSPARVPAGLRMQQSLPPSSGGPTPPTVAAHDTARSLIPQRYGLPEESGLSVVVDREQVTYDIDLKP
jgi:hypothetical protein